MRPAIDIIRALFGLSSGDSPKLPSAFACDPRRQILVSCSVCVESLRKIPRIRLTRIFEDGILTSNTVLAVLGRASWGRKVCCA